MLFDSNKRERFSSISYGKLMHAPASAGDANFNHQTRVPRLSFKERTKSLKTARHSSKFEGFLGLGLARGNLNNFEECPRRVG
jgi:hypothetical protein